MISLLQVLSVSRDIMESALADNETSEGGLISHLFTAISRTQGPRGSLRLHATQGVGEVSRCDVYLRTFVPNSWVFSKLTDSDAHFLNFYNFFKNLLSNVKF